MVKHIQHHSTPLLRWSRCKQFEFSSDLAREIPRKEEVIMSKCWRILKYIGTLSFSPGNIKITRIQQQHLVII